jgi:predicted dehydrogenase
MIAYQKVILDENPRWVFSAYKVHGEGDDPMQSGSFFCRYPSGVLAYNEWGMGFENRMWEWAIEGSKGRISYHPRYPSPHYLKVTTTDGEATYEIPPQGEGVQKDVRNFMDRILHGAAPYASEACTRDVIAVCEAADKSAQTEDKVEMDYR